MIISNLPFIMIKCLMLTIIIEVLFAVILKIRSKYDLLNIMLANILTNPIVVSVPVFINIQYGLSQRNICLAILEILTVIVEGTLYKKYLNFKKINPYILSLILNFASFMIGELINNI